MCEEQFVVILFKIIWIIASKFSNNLQVSSIKLRSITFNPLTYIHIFSSQAVQVLYTHKSSNFL